MNDSKKNTFILILINFSCHWQGQHLVPNPKYPREGKGEPPWTAAVILVTVPLGLLGRELQDLDPVTMKERWLMSEWRLFTTRIGACRSYIHAPAAFILPGGRGVRFGEELSEQPQRVTVVHLVDGTHCNHMQWWRREWIVKVGNGCWSRECLFSRWRWASWELLKLFILIQISGNCFTTLLTCNLCMVENPWFNETSG